ncbi:hypothetical protein BDN71DRAFT_1426892 [Pleurotus eryngii]|uniref:Uncharacterized protein n=1 Tax=Pleurotus eryngii TaxID=5323 RepID=A0A9P6AB31_PLEER|nr:hypothetical protein BDN71DRAFT_1426892 [Pleurotus eryngii]
MSIFPTSGGCHCDLTAIAQAALAQIEEAEHIQPIGGPLLPNSVNQEHTHYSPLPPFDHQYAMEVLVDSDDDFELGESGNGSEWEDLAAQQGINQDDNMDNASAICENSIEQLLALPESQAKLQAELLNSYTCSKTPPSNPANNRASTMTKEE